MEMHILNIYMIGVNYKTASIELREKVSFTQSKIKKMLEQLKEKFFVSGAVIISTCNRTELYISSSELLSEDNLVAIFCQVSDVRNNFV